MDAGDIASRTGSNRPAGVTDGLLGSVRCPGCAGKFDVRAPVMACDGCGQVYPRLGRIPVLLPRPEEHITLWRQQLALVTTQGHQTLASIEEQANAADLLPNTRARLRALAQGVRDQTREITDLLGPPLGGTPPAPETAALPGGADAPIQQIHLLYRDWGWERDGHPENQAALAAVAPVIGPAPLGRTLVLGGGACRLSYDLHRLHGATETAVLDVDPFVFTIAEAVVRGASIPVTESSPNINEGTRAAIRWTLTAPSGPLEDDRFHFFFADGLAPPFAAGTFDTVVTPWFIDQIPSDLPALLTTIARLLRPGGRWINYGPLIYPANAPLSRRFSREEVFDLTERAGFRIARWSTQVGGYLVTPVNMRGKVEWVLAFEAMLT